MNYTRLLSSAFLLVALAINTSCFPQRPYVPIKKETLKGSGRVYLVPLGDFSEAIVQELTSYYRQKYGLPVEALPKVHLPPSARNPERQQLIAEQAVDLMRRVNSDLTKDPGAILIGLTTEDMYIDSYDWRFSFSWREQGKYAVVSSGRMNRGRHSVSEETIRARLRKMVTKNVGILYYHLPQSDDPRSVLYRNVGSIRELDHMGEDF